MNRYLAAILILLFTMRLVCFNLAIFNVDEATSAVIANNILDGKMPYQAAIDTRTPLGYYLYAFIFWLFGKNNMTAIHLVFNLLITLAAGMIYDLGKKIFNRRVGLWAALFFAVFSWSNPPFDTWAAHLEWLVILFSMSAIIMFIQSELEKSRLKLFAAGLLFGLSILSKQVAVLDVMSVGLFLLLKDGIKQDKVAWRPLLVKFALLGGGIIIPVALCLFYFYAQGALPDMIFCVWTYMVKYFISVLTLKKRIELVPVYLYNFFLNKPVLLILGTMGCVYALKKFFRNEGSKQNPAAVFTGLFSIWGVSTLFGAAYSGVGSLHYFIQALPPVVILAGFAVDKMLTSGVPKKFLVSVIVANLLFAPWYTVKKFYPYYFKELESEDYLVKYLRLRTIPEDTLFVWGFYPNIYVRAERMPAARYTYCQFLTGLLAWFQYNYYYDAKRLIVPGTWEILMRELEENKPKYIVDTSSAGLMGYKSCPIQQYPLLWSYINQYYQLDPHYPLNAHLNQIHIYVRR